MLFFHSNAFYKLPIEKLWLIPGDKLKQVTQLPPITIVICYQPEDVDLQCFFPYLFVSDRELIERHRMKKQYVFYKLSIENMHFHSIAFDKLSIVRNIYLSFDCVV